MLLQLETFAFLAGTLLLFIILCVIMALTVNMKLNDPKQLPVNSPDKQVETHLLSPCGDGKERKDNPSQSSLLDNNVIDA